MKLPFLRKRIRRVPKPRTVVNTPDADRIQREINYRKRIGQPSIKLRQLQEKTKSRHRRSYG